jgi:hypothetical protein
VRREELGDPAFEEPPEWRDVYSVDHDFEVGVDKNSILEEIDLDCRHF